MKINSTQNKKYFWLFLAAFFYVYKKVINHHRFHQTNSLENFLKPHGNSTTSPRALSWAATAGYKFHHCQVLLITSNKLFGGEQSLAHRLFSFAWKQEVCLGSSDTLEFGLKLPACLIALSRFLLCESLFIFNGNKYFRLMFFHARTGLFIWQYERVTLTVKNETATFNSPAKASHYVRP